MVDNPKARQSWIADLIKSKPDLSYNDCFAEYAQRFSKTRRTFTNDWSSSQGKVKEYREKANLAKEEASIKMEVKAVKNGLKTKFDRVMFYQNQIELMEKQLTGEEKLYFIVGNKPVVNPNSKGEYILPIEKQNEIRKQIKEYQIEISKIEGDYEKHNDQKTPKQNLTMAKVKMVIKERNNL